jgi:hypothetical protein
MTTTTRAEPEPTLAEPRPPARPGSGVRAAALWLWNRPRAIVSTCSVVAGVWAVTGSQALFPYLSNNHDEAVYLLQANAIEHGHLFPRAGANPEAFLPWLTAQEGHRFVPKYAPVFPTILAIGHWVFRSERAALALIAAGVIVMTYLLATEILEDRRHAALASVFMLLTPLFIIQSATFLPYTTELLLLTSFAYCLFRGLRLEKPEWLIPAGSLLGIAFFARPYDALLVGLPLAIYVLLRYRHNVRTLLTNVGAALLGLLPPAVAVLAFNHAATGRSLSSPFSLIDSRDTIGFGDRSMDPNAPGLKYTPGLGWTGLSRHTMLTIFWCFGGLVLVGCAIYFLSQHRFRGRVGALGATAIALPIGYLFFWGTYGAAVWGAPWYLGPYYYMPIFAPIVILGTGGFIVFTREWRQLAVWGLVGMLVLSGFVTAKAFSQNRGFAVDDRHLNTAFEDVKLHNAIVFLPGLYGPRVLHPYANKRNNWNATGDVIYAVDRGDAANLEVAVNYPNRTPYKVTVEGVYRGRPYDPNMHSTLTPLKTVHGRDFDLSLRFKNPTASPVVTVTVDANGRSDSFVIDRTAREGSPERLDVHVTADATTATGRVLEHRTTKGGDKAQLQVQIGGARTTKAAPKAFYVNRYPLVVRDGMLYVAQPGQEINGFLNPDPLTFTAR